MIEIPKNSIFKWIGGKKWLSKDLKEIIEENIEDKKIDIYIEPFVGGLGSFKAILPILIKKKVKKIILNDINKSIINTFKVIKNEKEELIKELEKTYIEFESTFPKNKIKTIKRTKQGDIEGKYYYYELNKTKDKEELKDKFLKQPKDFFNKIKKEFNEDKLKDKYSVKTVAKFLFLMDNCFNGVYRENKKGEYNVPFNWDNKKVNWGNKIEIIKKHNKLFNEINIEFENKDVFKLLEEYKNSKNSFIYLDPPYYNENGGENKYNRDIFSKTEQTRLIAMSKEYDNVLYSNHYEDFLIKEFEEQQKEIVVKEVFRKNIMSSNKDTRDQDKKELLLFRK